MSESELSRLALGIEYDGSGFYGFQTQAQEPTVQAVLERALSVVGDAPVTIHGAGRTDTGVHARCQVAHFDPPVKRSLRSWLLGANSNLPDAASVIWVKPVPGDFHARFSASSRVYRYRILNRWPRPALNRSTLTWIRHPLNAEDMHRSAQLLLGEHDFTSFRAQACQARHARRRIIDIQVTRHSERVEILIEGNAFLHHMVRNIVGSLLLVGRGERPVEWIKEVLDARDRKLAGATAPAEGLCLEAVRYPERYQLPREPSPELKD